jgi:hypothetical protein
MFRRSDLVTTIQAAANSCHERNQALSIKERAVCTENLIRVDAVMESPKLAE